MTTGESCDIEIKKGSHILKASDGPLYLSILISVITIDSRSAVSYISKTVSKLYVYTITFNEFVCLKINTLTERGE